MILKLSVLFCFLKIIRCHNNTTLELVHVLFRHGHRVPTLYELCPNDPYLPYWWKFGYGELTPIGEQRSFELGQLLKSVYKDFIPKSFNPNEIKIRATYKSRTKYSALWLIAGLFFPNSQNLIKEEGQSKVPIQIGGYNDDYVFGYIPKYCPVYREEMMKIKTTNTYAPATEKYKDVLKSMSERCQKTYHTLLDAMFLYQVISSKKYLNFTLLGWEKELYDPLHEMSVLELHFQTINDVTRKLSGGRLLQKIFEDMRNKINLKSEKKLYVYSAHDVHVFNVLSVFNHFLSRFPDYNSAVTIELHKDHLRETYYVKVFYIENAYSTPKEINVKGCGKDCELRQLQNILKPFIPENYTKECRSSEFLD